MTEPRRARPCHKPVLPQAVTIAVVFALVSMPCLLLWAWLGREARQPRNRPVAPGSSAPVKTACAPSA